MNETACKVVPASSEHAVLTVVFVCELAANLSTETIAKAIHRYDSETWLSSLFPKKTESRPLSISVEPKHIGVQQEGNADGLILERVAPDGRTELALQLQGNKISFICNRYSRWESVSNEAIDVLTKVVDLILPQPGLSAFGLQYVDEFYVVGDYSLFKPTYLFSESSRLPAYALSQSGAWHSHTGWFEEGDSENERILNNLNVGIQLQPERLVVQVVGAHRALLGGVIVEEVNIGEILRHHFDKLHEKNKDVLRELLNKSTLEMIHLNGA